MRIKTPNDPSLWYTLHSSMGATDLSVQVKTPALTELLRVQAKCGFASGQPDFAQYSREIAKRWFEGFRGCETESGEELPNTLENRVMLMDNKAVYDLVIRALNDSGEWRAEGNAVAD